MPLASLPQGYLALVIGASGGIGSAVVQEIREDPDCAELIAMSRSGGDVDITVESSVEAAAANTPTGLNLIFCATGALTIDGFGPEKSLRQLVPEEMLKQLSLNAVGPALVLKHFGPKLVRGERGVMAFLSARVGSIGDNRLGGWISYRASKAALNQIVRTAAIEMARTHPQAVIAALHPGTVATSLSADYAQNRHRMAPRESVAAMFRLLSALTPDDTGTFHAYDGTVVPW